MGPVREEMGGKAGRKEWLWNKFLLGWALGRPGRLFTLMLRKLNITPRSVVFKGRDFRAGVMAQLGACLAHPKPGFSIPSKPGVIAHTESQNPEGSDVQSHP